MSGTVNDLPGMARRCRRYARAPITEAVIDIRVSLPRQVGLGTLSKMHASEKGTYPRREERWEGQASFEGASGAAVSRKTVGYQFRSSDGLQVFQSRRDGFTFSRLAPYDYWDPFRNEARRLWDVYRAMVHPERIERVAVRYINRLDIPLPIGDLKDFLRTAPEVTPDLPQGLSGYFMQLQIPLQELEGVLVLNETIIGSKKPDVVSIVLDIDISREHDVPQDEEGVWSMFERLRHEKNKTFEACITDKTRRLID